MFTDEVRTPQALKTKYASLSEIRMTTTTTSSSSSRKAVIINSDSNATPTNGAKQSAKISPNMSVISTPPPKRFHKVCNPFEGALAERLHLPLIGSPSLFQCRSGPPQLCSTQFEWDIEDVSRLKPVHVEPHESQFHDSPDPELESKAQLAISTFFKESHIAPSPVDCPLRSQRIILSEIDVNTPISNKVIDSRRIRDCEVQTELTLPPILPLELEEALRPYFQPHLAGSMTVRKKSFDVFNCSMRRKLFDLHNVIVLNETDEKPAQMVGSSPNAKQTLIAGRLSESESATGGDGSFGCLSPIRNLCGLTAGTPDDGNGSQSTRKRKKLLHELELPSPIAPSEHLSRRQNRSSYRELSNNNSTHVTLSEMTGTGRAAAQSNFTPDRSSSPVQMLENTSIDSSINKRVSRLRVNSMQRMPNKSLLEETELASFDDDDDDGDDGGGDDVEEEDDDMQLSSQSFNCSSTNSDTPRGHRRRRSANRKNLSQSFIFNTDDLSSDREGQQPIGEDVVSATATSSSTTTTSRTSGYPEYVAFYRTDSGFNETCSTSTFALSQEQPLAATVASCQGSEDVSMDCCANRSIRS